MKSKIEAYLKDWESKGYSCGIPNEVPLRLNELNKAPSYKKIALAILNCDHNMKSLGFSCKKSAWYDHYKKLELIEKGAIIDNQLKLDL
tara:strand:+ start:1489 stop:1755 length:267 start_codon:yes stop_codon:yes gene_type:complete